MKFACWWPALLLVAGCSAGVQSASRPTPSPTPDARSFAIRACEELLATGEVKRNLPILSKTWTDAVSAVINKAAQDAASAETRSPDWERLRNGIVAMRTEMLALQQVLDAYDAGQLPGLKFEEEWEPHERRGMAAQGRVLDECELAMAR
jgi:hypothetical protein